MGNSTSFDTAVNMVKRKYPEVFFERQLDAFANTLGEYHKYLTQILNILPMLLSEEPEDEALGDEALGDEEPEANRSLLLSRAEEGLYESGLAGITMVLSEIYPDFLVQFQDYEWPPQFEGPADHLLRLIGLGQFADTSFDELKTQLTSLQEKDVAAKPKAISIFDEDTAGEEPEYKEDEEESSSLTTVLDDVPDDVPEGIEEVAVFDEALARSPKLLRKIKPTDLVGSLNAGPGAFMSETSPRSFQALFDKAQEESDGTTPLTFSAFFKRYGSKSLGGTIQDGTFIFSREYTDELLKGVESELAIFSKEALTWKEFVGNFKGGTIPLESSEASRQNLADNFDRFMASIRMRDLFVKNLGENPNEKVFLSNHLIEDPYISHIYDFIYNIVFVDLVFSTFLERKLRDIMSGNKPDALKRRYEGGFDEEFVDSIEKTFARSIRSKIIEFLEGSVKGEKNICAYVLRSINKTIVYNSTFSASAPQLRANLINCTVCGKTIVDSFSSPTKIKDEPEVMKVRAELDSVDILVPSYSLFRVDKTAATPTSALIPIDKIREEGMLFYPPKEYRAMQAGRKITKQWDFKRRGRAGIGRFDKLKSRAKISEASPDSGMTWDQIEDLISSSTFRDSLEGHLRRAEALRSLGAEQLSQKEISIKRQKFFCPYEKSNRVFPYDIVEKKAQKAIDKCGFSLNLSSILDADIGGDTPPQTSVSALAAGNIYNPIKKQAHVYGDEKSLNEALDSAIKGGSIDDSTSDRIKKYFKVKSSGGWKFSKNYFRCPTHLSLPSRDMFDNAINKYRGYSEGFYLVSPVTGPTKTLASYDGDFDFTTEATAPPSDGAGGLHQSQDGTVVFAVCGAATSVSSIDYTTFQAKVDGLNNDDRKDLIDFLIKLGVDIADLMVFLGTPFAGEQELLPENTERIDKLATMLRMAAQSKVFSTKDIDIIGDTSLVCRHGHKFTINNSLYFGSKHYLHNIDHIFRKGRDGKVTEDALLARDSLFDLVQSSGEDNFNKAVQQGFLKNFDDEMTTGRNRSFYEDIRYKPGLRPKNIKFEHNDSEYFFPKKGQRSQAFAWGAPDQTQFGDILMEHGAILKPSVLEAYYPSILTAFTETNAEDRNSDRSVRQDLSGLLEEIDDPFSVSSERKYNETIARVLSSTLSTCANFLRLSSSPKVRGPLVGEFVSSFAEIYRDNKEKFRAAIAQLINTSKEQLSGEDGPSRYLDRISTDVIFDKYNFSDFLESFESEGKFLFFLDRDFLKIILNKVLESLYAELSELIGADSALSKREQSHFVRALTEFLVPGKASHGGLELALLESPGAIEIYSLIGPDQGDISDLQKGLRSSKTSMKLSKMMGREYYGRIISAASAHYIAEKISIIYNTYFRDISPRYTYYDLINIDEDIFVSPASIIEYCSTSPVTENILLQAPEDGDSLSKGIYLGVLKSFKLLTYDIVRLPEGLETASLNDHYQSLAVKYIKEELGSALEKQRIKFSLAVPPDGSWPTKASAVDVLNEFEYFRPSTNKAGVPSLKGIGTEVGAFWEDKGGSLYISQPGDADLVYKITFYEDKPPSVGAVSLSGQRLDDVSLPELVLFPAKSHLILNKIFGNKPVSKIPMHKDSKYAKQFSPSYLLGGRKREDDAARLRVMSIPTWSADHYVVNGVPFSSPVFDIYSSKGGVNSFEISDPSFPGILDTGDIVVLTKVSSEELEQALGSAPAAIAEGDILERLDIGNDYTLYRIFGRAKGLKLASASSSVLSLIDHPNTRVKGSDEDISVVNDRINFDSSNGFSVGPQSNQLGMGVLFPPTISSASNIGVSVPLEIVGTGVPSENIPIVNANIEVAISDDFVIEISDLLQRSPVSAANNLLIDIIKLYEDFKGQREEIGKGDVDELEAVAKARAKGLFKEYRGMPFNVVRSRCTTGVSAENIGTIDAEGDRSRYSAVPGYYIPLNNYVILNKILTLECFSGDWAGHEVFLGDDASNPEALNTAKQFVIKSHGLDYIAKQLGIENTEDMLDPYANRAVEGLGKLIKNEDYNEFGLRTGGSTSEQTRMRARFPQSAAGLGRFYSIHGNEEDAQSYMQVTNILYNYETIAKEKWTKGPSGHVKTPERRYSTKEVLAEIQSKDSNRVMTLDEIYAFHINTLSGFSGEISPTLKDNKGKPILKKKREAIGVRQIEQAIARYYSGNIKDILSALNPIKKEAGLSEENLSFEKYLKVLRASRYSEAIIVDEDLRSLWSFITGSQI